MSTPDVAPEVCTPTAALLTGGKARIRAFLLAGDALVTMENTARGTRHTYSVRASKDGALHFVSVRSGEGFSYLGLINARGTFYPGAKSPIPAEDARMVGFGTVWAMLWDERRALPAALRIWHEGACGRCSNPLTDPLSVAIGYGPECAQKVALSLDIRARLNQTAAHLDAGAAVLGLPSPLAKVDPRILARILSLLASGEASTSLQAVELVRTLADWPKRAVALLEGLAWQAHAGASGAAQDRAAFAAAVRQKRVDAWFLLPVDS